MKKIITSILCLFLFSCEQEKLEFIPSKTINNVFFLNHKEDSSCMLDDFLEDELASYIITKCKADTTKLIGIYLFYGSKGAERNIFKPEVDTIKTNSFFTPNRSEGNH